MGTTLCLIFCRKTKGEHCKPSTITSLNAEQAMELTQQQGLLQLGKRRSWAVPNTAAWRTPTVQLVVNVPPQTVSSCSTGGVQAMSLDYKEDSDRGSPFHETSRCIMMKSSPVEAHLDPMWQMMMWLEACGENLGEEDITWWLLVMPLTDGGTAATKELTKHLVSVWRWMAKVSTLPLCPPAPTMLNIGQFLEGCPKEEDHTPWLLAYAHALQHVGEAAEGRTWHPSGVHFTPQMCVLADDPATNGTEWIPVRRTVNDLSPMSDATAQELNNITVPDSPEDEPQIDHFGEQQQECVAKAPAEMFHAGISLREGMR